MSKEIKEIFETLINYTNLTPDAMDDLYYLQGYIEKKMEEIDRLNNIINELEKYLKENIKLTKTAVHFERLDDYDTRKYKRDIALFEMVLDKLKELKDSD